MASSRRRRTRCSASTSTPDRCTTCPASSRQPDPVDRQPFGRPRRRAGAPPPRRDGRGAGRAGTAQQHPARSPSAATSTTGASGRAPPSTTRCSTRAPASTSAIPTSPRATARSAARRSRRRSTCACGSTIVGGVRLGAPCWRPPRTGSPTASATTSTRRCAWPPSRCCELLVDGGGFSLDEAYSLASVAVDLGVTQVVDGTLGCHAAVAKSIAADLLSRAASAAAG